MPLLDIVLELFVCPHVLLGEEWVPRAVLVVLLDGVVRQVNGLVKVFQCVLLGAEAEVAVLIEPDGQGVPVGDQEPLPDVELTVIHQ